MKAAAQLRSASISPNGFPAIGIMQRKCACGQHAAGGDCEECRKKKEGSSAGYTEVQRKSSSGSSIVTVPSTVREVLQTPGKALDSKSRDYFESSFGSSVKLGDIRTLNASQKDGSLNVGADSIYEQEADDVASRVASPRTFNLSKMSAGPYRKFDFSGVRVHTDARSAESARAVSSLAYTVGNHIVFANGHFNPSSESGRRLLAHELTHVAQQAGAGRLVQRVPEVKPVELPQEEECENRADITKEFQDFVKDLPTLLQSAQEFIAEQRTSFKTEFDRVLASESGVDIKQYKVISCDVIHSDLLGPREVASAQVDSQKKEVRLSKSTKALIDDFRSNKTKTSLLKLLESLAHEKRHVTIAGALKADPKALLPGRSEDVAQKATYRAEEILTTVEEIVVGRMAVGGNYAVSVTKQEKLRRQNNMIRNFVTEAEYKRLRSIIIAKLRERYGFGGGCDTQLTLGVLTSMEHNHWYFCSSRGPDARVTTPIPEGLKICSQSAMCPLAKVPSKVTENEEGAEEEGKENIQLVP